VRGLVLVAAAGLSACATELATWRPEDVSVGTVPFTAVLHDAVEQERELRRDGRVVARMPIPFFHVFRTVGVDEPIVASVARLEVSYFQSPGTQGRVECVLSLDGTLDYRVMPEGYDKACADGESPAELLYPRVRAQRGRPDFVVRVEKDQVVPVPAANWREHAAVRFAPLCSLGTRALVLEDDGSSGYILEFELTDGTWKLKWRSMSWVS
jgi:hypothetical protein